MDWHFSPFLNYNARWSGPGLPEGLRPFRVKVSQGFVQTQDLYDFCVQHSRVDVAASWLRLRGAASGVMETFDFASAVAGFCVRVKEFQLLQQVVRNLACVLEGELNAKAKGKETKLVGINLLPGGVRKDVHSQLRYLQGYMQGVLARVCKDGICTVVWVWVWAWVRRPRMHWPPWWWWWW
jgi:hypothetical protein